MSRVLSSMSEILRVGGWALRGIGYPFGVAERGVRLLAWTEAAGGEAIKSLRLAEPAVAQSHGAAPCERAGDPGAGRVLRANGRHLIEIGAPAVDLVTHDARHTAAGHLAVHDVFGLAFLPSLGNLLAHRQLSGVFIFGAAEVDRLPLGWPRKGWLAVQAGAKGPVFVHGNLEGTVGAAVRSALRDAGSALAPRLADGAIKDIEAAVASGPLGYMGILAVSDSSVLVRDLLEMMRSFPEGVEFVDFPGRISTALSEGVPMEAGDLKYLYDLELRTWAPTSERSRSQAGYGVY